MRRVRECAHQHPTNQGCDSRATARPMRCLHVRARAPRAAGKAQRTVHGIARARDQINAREGSDARRLVTASFHTALMRLFIASAFRG